MSDLEGWGTNLRAAKVHYFVAGVSLCGKWTRHGGWAGQESGNERILCAVCRKKVKARRATNTKEPRRS